MKLLIFLVCVSACLASSGPTLLFAKHQFNVIRNIAKDIIFYSGLVSEQLAALGVISDPEDAEDYLLSQLDSAIALTTQDIKFAVNHAKLPASTTLITRFRNIQTELKEILKYLENAEDAGPLVQEKVQKLANDFLVQAFQAAGFGPIVIGGEPQPNGNGLGFGPILIGGEPQPRPGNRNNSALGDLLHKYFKRSLGLRF